MTAERHGQNPKTFWNLLGKLKDKKPSSDTFVKSSQFLNHFKSMFSEKSPEEPPPRCENIGPLDYQITMDELENVVKSLKPGKAVGVDNIHNEMLYSLFEAQPKIMLKLFNNTLNSGEVTTEWVTSLIVPIHKKDEKTEPSNYRGISLISCFCKIFLSILNHRLFDFTQKHNILHRCQLGYCPGNRTSDAHIIMNNLIKTYCHENNQKIYSCFVDFSNAFDTIPREKLFKKLLSYNITGKFFNIIRNIYMADQGSIKIGNQYTERFDIGRGVRQGCVLSPLLFNIFMADLFKQLDDNKGKMKIGDKEIACIAWADDLIIMSESESELQSMLETLEEYCEENRLTINTDKTKCMVFNKSGRLIRKRLHINGITIENVRSYKYLGFLLTPSGELNSG